MAGSDGTHLNSYLHQERRSFNFPMMKLKLYILKNHYPHTNDPIFQNFSRDILILYRCCKIIVIISVIELRVIQLKAIFQAKAHVKYLAAVHWSILFFLCFERKAHLLQCLDFLGLGATFLRKCLSVNRGTVLSDACRPGTISAARANFVNRPSTNRILYKSCCTFLPVTYRQTTNELRTAEFSCLLKSLRCHLVNFPLDHVHVQQLALQIDSPHVMIIINHAQRLLCFLAFVKNPLCVCTLVCWHHSYITFLTPF